MCAVNRDLNCRFLAWMVKDLDRLFIRCGPILKPSRLLFLKRTRWRYVRRGLRAYTFIQRPGTHFHCRITEGNFPRPWLLGIIPLVKLESRITNTKVGVYSHSSHWFRSILPSQRWVLCTCQNSRQMRLH